MRVFKLFCLLVVISVVLVMSFSLPVSAGMPDSSPRTYTVMVGLENSHQGIGVNSYFPESVTIHVGDTVHWVQNTHEIHTVTFLAGAEIPELIVPSASVPGADPLVSPLILNPVAVNQEVPAGGQYDGSAFATSGLMGLEPGEAPDFRLTFMAEGTFSYVCLVHGTIMSGNVAVVAGNVPVSSPDQVTAKGKQEIAQALSQIPAVQKAARE
jgi:plastocyanin